MTSPSEIPRSRTLRVVLTFALFASIALVGCKNRSAESGTPESQGSESDENESDEASSPEADSEAAAESAESDSKKEADKKEKRPAYLTGRVTPGRVTELYSRWRERVEKVEVDDGDAEALGDVEPGAEVTVYFATWCPDSRREVPRLWKSLRSAGGDVPFSVDYVALDHDFNAGDVSLEGKDIQFVPTFVVERDGEEVGRIVESAPSKLERDLHALLAGDKSGVLSKRDDL